MMTVVCAPFGLIALVPMPPMGWRRPGGGSQPMPGAGGPVPRTCHCQLGGGRVEENCACLLLPAAACSLARHGVPSTGGLGCACALPARWVGAFPACLVMPLPGLGWGWSGDLLPAKPLYHSLPMFLFHLRLNSAQIMSWVVSGELTITPEWRGDPITL